MSGAIATAAIIGGTAALGGAAISANAAGNAADTQANAAKSAAQLQYQASQNALGFQQQQFNTTQQNMQPGLQSGTGALSNLNYLMGITPMTSQQFQSNAGTLAPTAQRPMLPGPGATGTPPGAPSPSGAPMLPGSTGGSPTAAGGPVAPHLTPGLSPSGGPIGGNNADQAGAPSPTGAPLSSINPTSNVAGFTPAMGSSASGAPSLSGGPSLPPGVGGATPSATGSPASPSPGGFGSLMQGYGQTFQAPTAITEQNDPGYQARMNIGADVLQRSAAARGGVLTGGTAKALDTYGQDYASNEYNNVYNRALTGYDTNYNVFQQNQANQFNRLAAISGIGQTAAGNLANAGQAASNNVSSNLLGTAQGMGQQLNNAAAANASGIVGSANAWGGALGNTGNNLSQLLMLQQLQGGGGGTANYGSGSYTNEFGG
jgi:predicted flap endonuclease-1-like 5' DNA nuclease